MVLFLQAIGSKIKSNFRLLIQIHFNIFLCHFNFRYRNALFNFIIKNKYYLIDQGMENTFKETSANTKANGKMISRMEKENSYLKQVR